MKRPIREAATWFRCIALMGAILTCPSYARKVSCAVWSSLQFDYSVCIPNGWFRRTMPSGALFLCNDVKGTCTTAVGGGPLIGHATISLLPAELVLDNAPTSLDDFAHRVCDRDASSRFSQEKSVPGAVGTVTYISVTQRFVSGGRNEIPQVIVRYFIENDHRMFELILAFNRGDAKSIDYQDLAVDLVKSLKANVSRNGRAR